MHADKFERYEISQAPDGLHISLWQALPSLGFGVIVLVILASCFMTDPYAGHSKIWAGLGVVVLALVALFGVRIETWIIGESAVRYKSSLWSREERFDRSRETPLILYTELLPSDAEGTLPPYPHVVHLAGSGGIEIGEGFRFRTRINVDRFLMAIQEVVPTRVANVSSTPIGISEPEPPTETMPES